MLVNVPLAMLIPSSSGHGALAMPLLAPLADFAGVSRATTITAWIMGHGLALMVSPTSVVLVGGLAIAKVGYDKYLRVRLAAAGWPCSLWRRPSSPSPRPSTSCHDPFGMVIASQIICPEHLARGWRLMPLGRSFRSAGVLAKAQHGAACNGRFEYNFAI